MERRSVSHNHIYILARDDKAEFISGPEGGLLTGSTWKFTLFTIGGSRGVPVLVPVRASPAVPSDLRQRVSPR